MFIITNFRPEDMPGYKKKAEKAKKAAPKPFNAEIEVTQTAETDSKPAASHTSRKTTKSAQKPSKTEE